MIAKQLEVKRKEAAEVERQTKIENEEVPSEDETERNEVVYDSELANVHPKLRKQIEKERKHGSYQAWLKAEVTRKREAKLKAEEDAREKEEE